MFDLERAVAEWRRQMLAGGIDSPASLDELESHLREEMDRRMESGTDAQLAFEAAVREIGDARRLNNEFLKVEDTISSRGWRQKEILLALGTILISAVLGSAVICRTDILSRTEQISGLTAVAAFAWLAWGGRFSYRLFPAVRTKRALNAVVIPGTGVTALWWIVFLCAILPRCDLAMGQLTVAILWGFVVPGGAFIGFAWGMGAAAQKEAPASVR